MFKNNQLRYFYSNPNKFKLEMTDSKLTTKNVSLFALSPGVNFINILVMHFLYESLFSA
jgi:hypothetical protein